LCLQDPGGDWLGQINAAHIRPTKRGLRWLRAWLGSPVDAAATTRNGKPAPSDRSRDTANVSAENVDALRSVIDAFNRRDLAAARWFLDPDVLWEPTPTFFEDKTHGREATLAWFGEAFDSDWDQIKFDVAEFHQRGQHAVALGRLTGKAKRSGIEIDAERAWAATFDRRKVARMVIHERWETAMTWLDAQADDKPGPA
jgi:ketosteroid isomerase-like protein